LIEMARQFNEAARRGDDLKLTDEELSFYDALETNEASVRELGNDTLRKIAVRSYREPAEKRLGRLVCAGYSQGAAATTREAHPAEIQVSA
jgi:type I site-specific restriction-modification system R (restriction) subunit